MNLFKPNQSDATLQYARETTVPSSYSRSTREIPELRDVFRHQIAGLRYNQKEPDILMPPDREPAFAEATTSAISLFFSGFDLERSDDFFVDRQYKILLLEVMNPINKRLFYSEFANNIFDEKAEEGEGYNAEMPIRTKNWHIERIKWLKPDDQVGIRVKIYMYRYSNVSVKSLEEFKKLSSSEITEIINKELNNNMRVIKKRLSILLDNVDDILHDIEEKTDSEKRQYEMFRMWEDYVILHDIQEEYNYHKHYKMFSMWQDEQNDDRFRVSWIDKAYPIYRSIASALEYNRLNPPRSCPTCERLISGKMPYCKNCKKVDEERAEYLRLQRENAENDQKKREERAERLKKRVEAEIQESIIQLAARRQEREARERIESAARRQEREAIERIESAAQQKYESAKRCSFWQPDQCR